MVHAMLPEEMLFAPVIPPVLLAERVRRRLTVIEIAVVVTVVAPELSVAFAVMECEPMDVMAVGDAYGGVGKDVPREVAPSKNSTLTMEPPG